MEETEAKVLLKELIKNNLLSSCRKPDEKHLKDVCIAWWVKIGPYKHYGAKAWRKCFTMAEMRLGTVLKVYDFLAELNAYTPPIPKSKRNKQQIPATEACMEFMNKVVDSEMQGLPKLEMPKDIQAELNASLEKMDEKTRKWWSEYFGKEI